MPKSHSAATELAPLLDGSTAGELIPELVRHGLQQLIELEVAAVLGADRHERSEDRLGYRNGYRPRRLTTQVGDIDLQIPKLRSGSFLPSILEPRRRVDQALYAVVMEAYVAPQDPLAQDLEHQPAGAGQRGNQAPHQGVVGIFPNDAAITRLVGAVLLEQDEHWQLEGRRMFSAESMAAIPDLDGIPALLSASACEGQNAGPR